MSPFRSAPRPLVLLFGLGLGLGGALCAVGPALAQQSGAPKSVPTVAPTPTGPNARVVGQLPERTMMYTKRTKFNASAGVQSSDAVYCNSASDVPVAGACTYAVSSSAVAISNDMIDWGDTSRPAGWRCTFGNPGSSVNVEAVITCKRTQ